MPLRVFPSRKSKNDFTRPSFIYALSFTLSQHEKKKTKHSWQSDILEADSRREEKEKNLLRRGASVKTVVIVRSLSSSIAFCFRIVLGFLIAAVLFHWSDCNDRDGEKTVVGGQDADFWCIFEAEEQLMHLGVEKRNISAMWYKDLLVEEFDIGLIQFENDRDAIEMVRLGLLRGYVELYVVHSDREIEGFPEIGYIDVGGGEEGEGNAGGEQGDGNAGVIEGGVEGVDGEGNAAANGGDVVVEEVVETKGKGVAKEADGADVAGVCVEGVNDEEGGDVGKDGDDIPNGEEAMGDVSEGDGEDEEYAPSDECSDKVDDIHFTDRDDEDNLDDDWFREGGRVNNENDNGKGKNVVSEYFFCDEAEDSDDLEGGQGLGDKDEGDMERAAVNMFPEHKSVNDWANYPWRVGTLYANRDEFKEIVSAYAVHAAKGVKFDYCDQKRIIAICVSGYPF
ncbi:hypothetical protein PIB30_027384 [Stylosanthes scabra]|uniref:PB1-like domain-containing protein n=1 Tax=Stylosanthes scabra TaxID=79078 RepID=A0ABU6UB17_9FABA|nr:hypothetical protein [Stylosanthes scabra]